MNRFIIIILMSSICIFAQNTISLQNRLAPHSTRRELNLPKKLQIRNISIAQNIKSMVTDAKIDGQLILMYAGYKYKTKHVYATAIGGQLKYELAKLDGFNAAAAIYFAQDINILTGNRYTNNQNNELSSTKGKDTKIAEAYINYTHKNFNFRVGRQVINTPLANNDPIRIIQDTYEAYILKYRYNNFTFIAGNLERWQGYDAGLSNGFIKIGKNGAWLSGVKFSNKYLDSSFWYYNILDMTNVMYIDSSLHYKFSKNIFFHTAIQYLNESQLKSSGISTNIYGAMAEIVSHGINIFIAYNKAIVPKDKHSFSGFGGGTLYTSMDTMILDNIAIDRGAQALVLSTSYTYRHISLFYSHGNFLGRANSFNKKAHIIEQDIRLRYQSNTKVTISSLVSFYNDAQNQNNIANNWRRVQIMASYNF